MLLLPVLKNYVLWHYTIAVHEILHLYRNFTWFIVHFSSLPHLFSSLFAPWKRITEERGNTFSLEALAGYVLINFISRVIGFMLRMSIISLGALSLMITFLGLLLVYVFWILAPIVIVGCFFFGISTLFTL